jgi:hypothetical protein
MSTMNTVADPRAKNKSRFDGLFHHLVNTMVIMFAMFITSSSVVNISSDLRLQRIGMRLVREF